MSASPTADDIPVRYTPSDITKFRSHFLGCGSLRLKATEDAQRIVITASAAELAVYSSARKLYGENASDASILMIFGEQSAQSIR